jgi:hypothetical protein
MESYKGLILFKQTPHTFGSKKSVNQSHTTRYIKNAWPEYKTKTLKKQGPLVTNT